MKLLHVHDRVMTLHDACTSETSRVLTVASLQRLKMEALIPAPADFEVQSVKFLKAQNHSKDQNSSHWTRIQRVPRSKPSADQTDWHYFHGFPQALSSNSSRFRFYNTLNISGD